MVETWYLEDLTVNKAISGIALHHVSTRPLGEKRMTGATNIKAITE